MLTSESEMRPSSSPKMCLRVAVAERVAVRNAVLDALDKKDFRGSYGHRLASCVPESVTGVGGDCRQAPAAVWRTRGLPEWGQVLGLAGRL